MPTAAPTLDEHPVWSIDPTDPGVDPLRSEWVLTNGLGGFAMGSVAGIPTRRYHGLLVAALKPPVLRTLAVPAVDDAIELTGPDGTSQIHRLTPFRFVTADDRPDRCEHLVRFEKDDVARWIYHLPGELGPVEVVKTLEIADGRNAAVLRYELPESPGLTLKLRPLVALRDFHALLTGHEQDASVRELPGRLGSPGVLVTRGPLGVHLIARGATGLGIHPEPWRGVELMIEGERGLDDHEDWFCPCEFEAVGSRTVELVMSTDTSGLGGGVGEWQSARDKRRRRRRGMIEHALIATGRSGSEGELARLAQLSAAADDFVVRRTGSSPSRDTERAHGQTTVIAGYPWFADWGRDTMIALPGLLLVTGRHAEAFDVLRTFAGAQRRGMIPNRFDDHAGPAHYNTVDASLWFIHACVEWYNATGDADRFHAHLRPACDRVIDAYTLGTDYNIKVDPLDGLVSAGSLETQLTWMDARRDGVVFTPRFGKAVEINALWVHGLRSLGEALGDVDPSRASQLDELAERASAGFRDAFLGGPGGGLVDCIVPARAERGVRWEPTSELRPNQIFAASLEHAPLDLAQRRAVVHAVRTDLLTPVGLRTLAPDAHAYESVYRGTLFERDRAYHNGTVWPWLLGPFCEALMRSESFSQASRDEARRHLLALASCTDGPSVGQLWEIADAEPAPGGTHRFDGCPAQAWSIAETLRVLVLATRPDPS